MHYQVVIIGGGHAAGQVCDSLRRGGYKGTITLITKEPFLPYQRPPLSKAFLMGKVPLERLFLRKSKFYSDRNIHVILNQKAVEIDRDRRSVILENGETIHYDKAVLTLGARAREIAIPGFDLEGVCYLRSLADARDIQKRLNRVENISVIGGGFIGLEVAAALRTVGKTVTVVELSERLMERAVGPAVSDYYSNLHKVNGVGVHLRKAITRFEGKAGRLTEIVCSDGTRFASDLAIVGIGAEPNDELAAAAGLTCDDGIYVDEFGLSSDPNILAAGDCTRHRNAFLERRLRLESVQNAVDQGKVVAATLCENKKPYISIPWFWSDQYDAKLQIVGVTEDYDKYEVQGNPQQHKFSVLYFKNGGLRGVESINDPKEHMIYRRLLAAEKKIPTSEAQKAVTPGT